MLPECEDCLIPLVVWHDCDNLGCECALRLLGFVSDTVTSFLGPILHSFNIPQGFTTHLQASCEHAVTSLERTLAVIICGFCEFGQVWSFGIFV